MVCIFIKKNSKEVRKWETNWRFFKFRIRSKI